MTEAEKYDELFDCDKQDYEFNHVKIKKKEGKRKNKFDIDNIKIEGAEADTEGSSGQQGDDKRADEANAEGRDGENAQGNDEDDEANERSTDMLSDDGSFDVDEKGNKIEHDLSKEKVLDVFKSLFSEFKEFIPAKQKPGEAAPTPEESPAQNKKEKFFSKAKGFFGL